MTVIDWIQPVFTVVLAIITGIYAWRTHVISKGTEKQADASVQMAEEMRNARFAAVKPIILIDWIAGERSQALSPYFHNIGFGPALNLKFYCAHKSFEFKNRQERTALEVGKREHITLLVEDFDFRDWDGLTFNCDYESIYGERFRSILMFKTERETTLEIQELKEGATRND